MSDDLDCSRRHGAKTIIAPLPSVTATLKDNGHIDHSSSAGENDANQHNQRHALHQDDASDNDAPCELDGQLSAMQSAAAKTALVVGKRSLLQQYLFSVVGTD
jgi:hypothetical protein